MTRDSTKSPSSRGGTKRSRASDDDTEIQRSSRRPSSTLPSTKQLASDCETTVGLLRTHLRKKLGRDVSEAYYNWATFDPKADCEDLLDETWQTSERTKRTAVWLKDELRSGVNSSAKATSARQKSMDRMMKATDSLIEKTGDFDEWEQKMEVTNNHNATDRLLSDMDVRVRRSTKASAGGDDEGGATAEDWIKTAMAATVLVGGWYGYKWLRGTKS